MITQDKITDILCMVDEFSKKLKMAYILLQESK